MHIKGLKFLVDTKGVGKSIDIGKMNINYYSEYYIANSNGNSIVDIGLNDNRLYIVILFEE